MSGYTKSGYILLSCTRISFSHYLISGNMICMINKLYPSSTSYSNNTSCSFCLFLHIFLPSLCSPFLYFSFPICLICFVLYSYISYLSTMFYSFYLFLFLYNFNVVNFLSGSLLRYSLSAGISQPDGSGPFATSPCTFPQRGFKCGDVW